MGVLGKLGSTAPSLKDPFFLVGRYKVELLQVKLHESSKDGNTLFIINGKVLESNVADRPVGMRCSQVIKITGNVSALGNIKTFVATCLDLDVNDAEAMATIDEDAVEELIESGGLVGLVLHLECTETLTQKKTVFTIHQWSLVKD